MLTEPRILQHCYPNRTFFFLYFAFSLHFLCHHAHLTIMGSADIMFTLVLNKCNQRSHLLEHHKCPIMFTLSTDTCGCNYHSRAGSRRHRSVSTPSKETDYKLGGEEFSTGGCAITSSFSHALPHLESFPVLLHSSANGGASAGVLQPDHWKGTGDACLCTCDEKETKEEELKFYLCNDFVSEYRPLPI